MIKKNNSLWAICIVISLLSGCVLGCGKNSIAGQNEMLNDVSVETSGLNNPEDSNLIESDNGDNNSNGLEADASEAAGSEAASTEAGNSGIEDEAIEIDFDSIILPDSYPEYVLNSDNVKLVGRNYLLEDNLWCALSGSGAEFIYYGEKLELTLLADGASQSEGNRARVAVYVNDARVIDKMLNSESVKVTVYEGTKQAVRIRIVKLSESANSTMGIAPIIVTDGEYVIPAEKKERRIEFIGDSITCGYGVDDENKDHHFSTSTEDVTKAWAYKTAELLDADYSIFSYSGWGICSGYTSNSSQKASSQLVPEVYDKLAFSYQQFGGQVSPQSIEWGFEEYQPDVIVINLGTNDASYCDTDDKKQEYVTAYIDFLKKIRNYNPNAYIFCALGTMGDVMYSSMATAVELYTKETGDENVSTIHLPNQSNANGYAADWHPTEASHDTAAMVAAYSIREIMGW